MTSANLWNFQVDCQVAGEVSCFAWWLKKIRQEIWRQQRDTKSVCMSKLTIGSIVSGQNIYCIWLLIAGFWRYFSPRRTVPFANHQWGSFIPFNFRPSVLGGKQFYVRSLQRFIWSSGATKSTILARPLRYLQELAEVSNFGCKIQCGRGKSRVYVCWMGLTESNNIYIYMIIYVCICVYILWWSTNWVQTLKMRA